ncbi:uncharacterized protein LOC134540303 [Bacillus rossius redtenbacheri]|uniref:uncharacterized protein LOC134540303 n=1 Tax=Bacillus rossius redtenbacheri TaxID=93214 RepID=UPI002FDD40D8
MLDFHSYVLSHVEQSTTTFTVSYLVTLFSILVTSEVGIIALWAKNSRRRNAFELLSTVDKKILGIAPGSHLRDLKSPKAIFVITSVVMFTAAVAKNLTFCGTLEQHLYAVGSYAKNVAILVLTGNYLNMVMLIQHRLRILDDELRKHTYLRRSFVLTTTNEGLLSTSSTRAIGCASLWCPRNRRSSLIDLFGPRVDLELDGFVTLVAAVRSAYNSLCNITSLVNDVYGTPIFFYLLTFCAVTTSNLLHILLFWFRPAYIGNSSISYATLFTFLLWTVFHILQTLTVIFACSATNRWRQTLSDTVIELLVEPGMSDDASKELTLFSDVIRMRRLEFSAGGFFTIDMPELFSMFSATVTYLIVLIQFSSP